MNTRRTRALGQYFTPRPVVELCYRTLRVLDPETSHPRVIDPACGEGAFLTYALEHGIANGRHLFGVEADPAVAAIWPELGLSSRATLFIHDGLYSDCTTPGVEESAFDWVVGNPPFGRRALTSLADRDAWPGTASLAAALENDFSIWPRRSIRSVSRLATFPVEVMFLERFCRLARPGGLVAMVVPDGVLANERLSYVREWLSEHASVEAVISLPQRVFARSGASAKSSILLFRRRPSGAGRIFMAALESRGSVPGAVSDLENAFRGSLIRPDETWHAGPWIAFCAAVQSPGSRLDPAWYHPKYESNLSVLERLPSVVPFARLIAFTTYGQVGGRTYTKRGVRLLSPANLPVTEEGFVVGVDLHARERFVAVGSRNDPPRSRLRRGDVLLSNSGVGCIGRAAVYLSDEPCNISQHLNLVRVRNIEPEYVAVYLQTRFARLQIARAKCGVGPSGINFDRIRSILIPVLTDDLRREIVLGYAEASHGRDGTAMRVLVGRLESEIARLAGCHDNCAGQSFVTA